MNSWRIEIVWFRFYYVELRPKQNLFHVFNFWSPFILSLWLACFSGCPVSPHPALVRSLGLFAGRGCPLFAFIAIRVSF
jgi:hypothetical protein